VLTHDSKKSEGGEKATIEHGDQLKGPKTGEKNLIIWRGEVIPGGRGNGVSIRENTKRRCWKEKKMMQIPVASNKRAHESARNKKNWSRLSLRTKLVGP